MIAGRAMLGVGLLNDAGAERVARLRFGLV